MTIDDAIFNLFPFIVFHSSHSGAGYLKVENWIHTLPHMFLWQHGNSHFMDEKLKIIIYSTFFWDLFKIWVCKAEYLFNFLFFKIFHSLHKINRHLVISALSIKYIHVDMHFLWYRGNFHIIDENQKSISSFDVNIFCTW